MNKRQSVPKEYRGGTVESPRHVTPAFLRDWIIPRTDGSKYSRGQVLVIGGARPTPGAAMLSGLGALRVGAGRLTLAVAESVTAHVAVAIPESGVFGLDEDKAGSITGHGAGDLLQADIERSDVILLGPGLVEAEGTLRLLEEVLPRLAGDAPVVLDAFGATMLPQLNQDLVKSLRGRLVLTPNTEELAFLLEIDEIDEDKRVERTLECASAFGAAVAMDTVVAYDDQVWEITTGGPGLGTSGSGDVSAGVISGLLARGAGLAQSVVWGKSIHSAAGDNLSVHYGDVGYLASELLPELPRTMRALGAN